MGNIEEKIKYEKQGKEFHALEGCVDVFHTTSDPDLILMTVQREKNTDLEELYQQVNDLDCELLTQCYGLFKKDDFEWNCGSNTCSNNVKYLWDFHHATPFKSKAKGGNLDEVVELLEAFTKIAKIFKKYGIFIEFSQNMIERDRKGNLRIYWGHLCPDNSHKSVFKYFKSGHLVSGIYAPEELAELRRDFASPISLTKGKIDFEKCEIFSLGLTLLSFESRKQFCQFYDHRSLRIKETEIQQVMNRLRKNERYSSFCDLLENMLQSNPQMRSTYQNIDEWLLDYTHSKSYVSLEDQLTASTFHSPFRKSHKVSLKN